MFFNIRHCFSILLIFALTACGGTTSDKNAGTNRAPNKNNDDNVSAKYKVNSEDLSLGLIHGTPTKNDQAIWNAVKSVLPNSILKAELGEFHIFTDGPEGTLAYVTQVDPDNQPEKWVYAVDPADSEDTKSTLFIETIIHEFGHIIALENDQINLGDSNCNFYEIDEGCAKEDSYLNEWYTSFWNKSPYKEQAENIKSLSGSEEEQSVANFYNKHTNDFINEYSATNPIEDFAESFAFFVLKDKAKNATLMKDKKINFFYDYPPLTAIRDDIRNHTSVRK